MKIVEYEVVFVVDSFKKNGAKLSAKVNEKISSGWQPIGGVTVANAQFGQAMVKYEQE